MQQKQTELQDRQIQIQAETQVLRPQTNDLSFLLEKLVEGKQIKTKEQK